MILHTILPPEMIFPNDYQYGAKQKLITRNGVPLIVEQTGTMYKVVRVMSSNPQDYIRSDIYPGTFISIYE